MWSVALVDHLLVLKAFHLRLYYVYNLPIEHFYLLLRKKPLKTVLKARIVILDIKTHRKTMRERNIYYQE